MQQEFINNNCILCDNCIYEALSYDSEYEPVACGTIDDDGCVSIPLKELNKCIKV